MAFNLRDKVRNERGLEGEIVLMNPDLVSALVVVPGNGRGKHIVTMRLECLTHIVTYTTKDDPSPA